MSIQETLRQHQRLAMLRALAEAPGYAANVSVLADVLHTLGLSLSRDQTVVEATWLAEQGLASVAAASGPVVTITLTDRGADVAAGRAVVPGIRRPSPGAAAMGVMTGLARGE